MSEGQGDGWWHPAMCIDQHDDDHNCLDAAGSIIGWREPHEVAFAGDPVLRTAQRQSLVHWLVDHGLRGEWADAAAQRIALMDLPLVMESTRSAVGSAVGPDADSNA